MSVFAVMRSSEDAIRKSTLRSCYEGRVAAAANSRYGSRRMVKAKQPKAKSIPSAASPVLKTMEWILAGALTLLALWLRLEMTRHAGGLWRDEANTVELAAMPKFSDVWQNLQFDSFPIFWLAVVRIFQQLGFHSDFYFRALGFIVGTLIIAALWFNARRLKISFPIFSLLLLGMTPVMIRVGDSMRGYGFGVFWLLLLYGLIWGVVESATPLRLALALVGALGAVHSIYYNAVILFALCVAGMIVTFRRGERKAALLLLLIGFIAAVSVLPYFKVIERASDWNALVQGINLTFTWFFQKLQFALKPQALAVLWIVIFIAAILVGIVGMLVGKKWNLTPQQNDRVLFSTTALVIGSVSYYVFLKVLNYPTQPWYYLALMGFCAMSFDAIFSVLNEKKIFRICRLALPCLAAAILVVPVYRQIRIRMTNVDLIAAEVKKLASEKDVIVVDPWYNGVSFHHYYTGPAEWMTVPPLSFYAFHRYDLFKEKMMATDQLEPLRPALDKMAAALSSGNHVWLVGGFRSVQKDKVPGLFPPAPAKLPAGYSDEFYSEAWGKMIDYFLVTRGQHIEGVPIPVQNPVNSDESLILARIQGWRESGK